MEGREGERAGGRATAKGIDEIKIKTNNKTNNTIALY